MAASWRWAHPVEYTTRWKLFQLPCCSTFGSKRSDLVSVEWLREFSIQEISFEGSSLDWIVLIQRQNAVGAVIWKQTSLNFFNQSSFFELRSFCNISDHWIDVKRLLPIVLFQYEVSMLYFIDFDPLLTRHDRRSKACWAFIRTDSTAAVKSA